MFKDIKAFSGFSVDDLDAARKFYGETLGLELENSGPGFMLKISGGNPVLVYPKEDHTPATFTILNFPVSNIDEAVDALTAKGVTFETYDNLDGNGTDEKGVMRGLANNTGPDIAWFKDPAGNILSVLQEA